MLLSSSEGLARLGLLGAILLIDAMLSIVVSGDGLDARGCKKSRDGFQESKLCDEIKRKG